MKVASTYDGYAGENKTLVRIDICYDYDPVNPREWDPMAELHFFDHHRFNFPKECENLFEVVAARDGYYEWEPPIECETDEEYQELLDEEVASIERKYHVFPIYVYDHSGIAFSVAPFSDRWDSSFAGYAFVSKYSTAEPERAKQQVARELDVYESYANGWCYGFEVYRIGKSGDELLSSCWGYLGTSGQEDALADAITENDIKLF